MLGLLLESELARYEGTSAKEITDATEFSFQDAIYKLDPKSELDFVEAVARKVLHEAEGYLSNVYERIDIVLYFRSYTGNKLILENAIDGLQDLTEPFDIDWCKETNSCSLAAWKDQLSDRILISKPLKPPIRIVEPLALLARSTSKGSWLVNLESKSFSIR